MVITGATGGIGKKLMIHLNGTAFDHRTDENLKCSVLVNCMGVNINGKAHEFIPFSPILTNLVDTLKVITMALPFMREQNFGRIINLTSFVAYKGIPGTTAYAASKGGLDSAIKAIAVENAKYNILINNLCLGYFDYGMTHKINNYVDLKKQIPVGEFGKISEIVNAVNFLVNSSYITGTTIHINGGLW